MHTQEDIKTATDKIKLTLCKYDLNGSYESKIDEAFFHDDGFFSGFLTFEVGLEHPLRDKMLFELKPLYITVANIASEVLGEHFESVFVSGDISNVLCLNRELYSFIEL